MKTIEEAAMQHCNSSQFKSDFPHDYHSEESGFKAGVEFAQRWIPVGEELPVFDKEKYPNGGPVYIMGENGLREPLYQSGFFHQEQEVLD